MSCYHPLVGLWKGQYNVSGKKKYEIVGTRDMNEVEQIYPGSVQFPCGHCIGCRLDYSRSWADRMMLELEENKKACFITLTYDNDNLPVSEYDENMIPKFATLDKRDCQLFLKRLRKYYEDTKIRFYLAGEYGDTTLRPHYHAIIYGIDKDNLNGKKFKRNELGSWYYTSDILSKIWNKGNVLIADVNWKTCAYVSRYVTKKLNGEMSINYAKRNCIKEFALMSRRPGLGKEYLEKHPDCLDYEEINLSTDESGIKLRIPKYYLKQLELTDPDRYAKIKEERKEMAKDSMYLKLSKTNLSYIDYLEMEEERKLKKIKSLTREKCD